MKLGGFGCIKDYADINNAGFDYAELDIPELEKMSEYGFKVFCNKVCEDEFPVLTGARALPIAEPWFFTEYFHLKVYEGYLERACRRAKMIGTKKIILGNGKARSVIDENGVDKEKNFIDFLRMFAEIAGEFEIEVILEPLGPQYTNYINTLPEAVRVIREVNMPNLFSMIDLRHMFWSKENIEDIEMYSGYIHHVHIDYPKAYPQRRFPKISDDYDYTPFLRKISKVGYDDTLTIEADIPENWKNGYNNVMELLKTVGI